MNMKTKTKTVKTAMLAAALALLTAGVARADTNPANDSGSFTVRITPNVDLGVLVDTTGANWAGAANLDVTSDLGTVNLLENPVSVAMAGNFANQELTLTGAALNTWVLDTDELDAVDEVRLSAMFSEEFFGIALVASDFDGAVNLIQTSATRAGQPEADEFSGDANHVYELPEAHAEYGQMDEMAPAELRKLWLRARTPNTTSTTGTAQFTVTVTAVTGVAL